ncbi:ROK family transcriptional regulator [Plantibacter flavus]|uniref:ROK family transcriptional regulator n=1 Tax=Plantibacter flavus TaxID=150123 RepID=UPI003F16A4CA
MQRGTNLPALGGYNRAVVLDLIRRAPDGLSRVELAGQTGLSAQTVSNVAKRLLADGVVLEAGKTSSGPGKPRTILQLEARARVAIGVHLDPGVISFVMLDLEGRVIAHSRSLTPSATSPAAAIDAIASSIEALIDETGVDREHVLGVGIAAPGPIDAARGILIDPPLLVGWELVELRDALLEATGLPVLLEKDVTAAAVAELWLRSGEQRDNFAFFYYGTGFGIGLVLGHEVVRGSSHNAGDAGHIIVDPRLGGDRCSCGRTGCVGVLIAPAQLVQEAALAGVVETAAGELDAERVLRGLEALVAAGERGNPAASELLDRTAARIADALVTVVNLLDVDRIVFGGPFWQPLGQALLRRLPEGLAGNPALVQRHEIVLAESGAERDITAVGAACLVLDNTFSPRPSALLLSR